VGKPTLHLSFSLLEASDWGPVGDKAELTLSAREAGAWVLDPTTVSLPNGEEVSVGATCSRGGGVVIVVGQNGRSLCTVTGYLRSDPLASLALAVHTDLGADLSLVLNGDLP
jgi:hypothetical protein